MAKFPWAEMMHMGLGTMQLSPTEFWRSTPREIAAALGSSPKPMDAKMLRQTLETMIKDYPDT